MAFVIPPAATTSLAVVGSQDLFPVHNIYSFKNESIH